MSLLIWGLGWAEAVCVCGGSDAKLSVTSGRAFGRKCACWWKPCYLMMPLHRSPLPFESQGDTCGTLSSCIGRPSPYLFGGHCVPKKWTTRGSGWGALTTLASALVGVFDPGSWLSSLPPPARANMHLIMFHLD